MIIGKVEQVVTFKKYDKNGKFLGEGAKYIYKPILLWRDVIIGLSVAFFAFAQMI